MHQDRQQSLETLIADVQSEEEMHACMHGFMQGRDELLRDTLCTVSVCIVKR